MGKDSDSDSDMKKYFIVLNEKKMLQNSTGAGKNRNWNEMENKKMVQVLVILLCVFVIFFILFFFFLFFIFYYFFKSFSNFNNSK